VRLHRFALFSLRIVAKSSWPLPAILAVAKFYVRAGIPAPEVLRMATLTPALVMGANKDRGVIAAGKLADMILVDGDPTKNIRDLDKLVTVIKAGSIYDPAAIEKALSIAPRRGPQD
jgi:imidazolonepropionase-like amidohydrolase